VGAARAGKAFAVRRIASWLAWFAGLWALWLLLAGTVSSTELIAGLVGAALAATAAEVVRSLGLLEFRVEWRWLKRAPLQLARVIPDFFLLLSVLVRPRRSAFRTPPFPAGGERAVDNGRRAWAALAGSLAPNRLVVDFDPERGEALVHDLVPQAAPDELL